MSTTEGRPWRDRGKLMLGGVAGVEIASLVILGAPATIALTVTVGALTGWRLCWVRLGSGRLRRELTGRSWAGLVDLARMTRLRGRTTRLGRTCVGPRTPVTCKVPMEESVALIGGTRRGKTLLLCDIVRRHWRRGGAVIASSTRFDVLMATVGARLRGRPPVWLFAPDGAQGWTGWTIRRMAAAGWLRLLRWDPIVGCEDPAVALARAAAFIEATDSGSADDRRWLDSATTVLRCLLRAAALEGRSMADVYRWITDLSTMVEAGEILLEHDRTWADELGSEVLSANDKGAASTLSTARLAVQFMALPAMRWTCCPEPDEPTLDVERLLAGGETLYLVTEHRKGASTAPLTAALTTHLFDGLVTAAKGAENGRLPNPPLLALDEAYAGARVDLQKWTSFAGGHDIHLVVTFQSIAQLREAFGADAADIILDTLSTKVVFGGIETTADVERFSARCGQDRSTGRRVLNGDELTNLPKFRAALLTGLCRKATVLATPRPRSAAPARLANVVPLLTPSAYRQLEVSRPAIAIEPRAPIALLSAERDQVVEREVLVEKEAA